MENKLISFTITFGVYCFSFMFLILYRLDKEEINPNLNGYCEVEIQEIKIEEQKITTNKTDGVKNKTQSINDIREINNEKSEDQKTEKQKDIPNQNKVEVVENIKLKVEVVPNKVLGGEYRYEGNVMVQWGLENRVPHNNNSWYVRNPGYMCGFEKDGVLYIEIVVDDLGNVIKTTIDNTKSSNLTTCIISNGLDYAKKSKFSPGKNKQRGYIIYKFIGQ